MKRFRFQLEPVLDFKKQGLDALMAELGAIQARVAAQQAQRDAAYRRLADYEASCRERRALGMTILELQESVACQQVLDQRAKSEDRVLIRLRREAEAKRDEVVEARKETRSLEKLRELRRNEYDAAVAKAEEKALDDLTAARRAAG